MTHQGGRVAGQGRPQLGGRGEDRSAVVVQVDEARRHQATPEVYLLRVVGRRLAFGQLRLDALPLQQQAPAPQIGRLGVQEHAVSQQLPAQAAGSLVHSRAHSGPPIRPRGKANARAGQLAGRRALEDIETGLRDLDRKVKALKLDYERYFLGTRPREPVLLRSDVDKIVVIFSNTAIQNTALRFRFNSIVSRYQALRRQWNETLRQIEAGTYARHRFKADLHERERRAGGGPEAAPAAASSENIFEEYRDARLACGQAVKSLTRDKLEGMLAKQKKALAERFGSDAKFRFRVTVEDGKAKLKASRVRDG